MGKTEGKIKTISRRARRGRGECLFFIAGDPADGGAAMKKRSAASRKRMTSVISESSSEAGEIKTSSSRT